MKPINEMPLEVLIDHAIRKKEESTVLDIKVCAGSKHTGLTGYDTWRQRLLLNIKEHPTGGRANASIIEFFSGLIGVPSHEVKIISGQSTPKKTVEIGADILEVKKAVLSALTPC